ncbi:MAG: flagellar biosynthesis protein FlhF [Deltaproteobacteria bacterium]|nr:flagellar biosynthesis protein FlhF [Deltaproteobacteria bacterium]MBW2019121.1 flagellar biosynthesis protein FlhF [Deltaproteobacteria bacterium]MBW2073188.1 flagellar biosynthesis protein FlhF [Deltaproteobacteria bacterium]
MQVRRYRASTIHDAVNLAKQELGPEALILSTRKIHGGKGGASAYRTQAFFEIAAMPSGSQEAVRSDSFTGQGLMDERASGFLGSLRSELMSIKEMIFLLSRSGRLMEGFRLNPEAIEVYGRLIRGGIAEPYAQLFLERGGAFEESGDLPSKDLHKRVFKEVSKVIEVTDPFSYGQGQVISALIGPTGVGKTTTIAKLAANLSLKQKKSVGFISIDNYRIAAIDHLKTYAGILGIPCFAAFKRAELEFALSRMKDKDVILIDTAGHGHYDLERIDTLRELIGHDFPIRTHLVLSTVTNELEMECAAKNFGRLNFSSYIFTKTDETRARGVIINQLLKLGMPISFITTGQRVPEDIFKATKTGILQLLFG